MGGGCPIEACVDQLRAQKSVRSQFYRAARNLGNVEAVKNGGLEGLAKRDARRVVYRQTNEATGSFLRALGLSGTRRK